MSSGTYSEYWWSFLVRGIVALLFGTTALVLPGAMLTVLVLFFGAYLLVDGAFAMIAAWKARLWHSDWWAQLLEGILSFLLGGLAFFMPGLTQVALILYIGIWAIVVAVLRFVTWYKIRHLVKDTWGMVVSCLAYLIFGILLLVAPLAGGLALMWCVGIWAIIAGICLVYFAFRLKPKS